MAATPSRMITLGSKAVDFKLIDTISDKILSLEELKGSKGSLIVFICNHCPFVLHINERLVQLANRYQEKGIQFIAISSNDVVNYPQDSPELMKQRAKELNYPFPYLYDEDQSVAKSYRAECTPDFFLYNSELSLVYRGQMDDSRPGNGKECTGIDLSNAFDALIENKAIDPNQKPSIGCNIKWK